MKTTRFLAVILIIVAALVAVPAASAAPFTPELEADYAASLAWWGVSSPSQCATVTREVVATDPYAAIDGPDAAARATQPAPGESGLACRLEVFADRETTGCVEAMEIRHEVGHLTGHGHEATGIMAPSLEVEAWCPELRAEEEAAQEAEQRAEGWAATREAWKEWRAERAACKRRSGPGRRECWRMVRSIAHYLRGTAGSA